MSVLCLALLTAIPAWAEGPEDTVRWIYTSLINPGPAESKGLAYLSAPSRRDQFLSRRLSAFYAANQSYGDDLAAACVDFSFDIPGNDFDAAEIVQSLNIETTGGETQKTVTAKFTNFGEAALVVYDFIVEDGFWRLDDIAGPGWRVANIPCTARVPLTGYCYLNGNDSLRLDLSAEGTGRMEMMSWQTNGHSCGAGGAVQPIEGGWVFRDPMAGAACQIEILVTPEQGLRLTDKDWACKSTLCGQRAVIDGIHFPRSSQIDCTQMPINRY